MPPDEPLRARIPGQLGRTDERNLRAGVPGYCCNVSRFGGNDYARHALHGARVIDCPGNQGAASQRQNVLIRKTLRPAAGTDERDDLHAGEPSFPRLQAGCSTAIVFFSDDERRAAATM